MKVQKLGNFGAVILTPEVGYMLTRYNEETTDILYYAGYTRVACNESQIVNYREITIEQHKTYMQELQRLNCNPMKQSSKKQRAVNSRPKF